MNLSVVLLLTAVMVTAKRDKVDDAKSNKVDRQSTDLTGLDLDTLAGEPEKDCPPWVSGCQQKAKKKEIKAKMADEDEEDKAESGEVDDAKSNKVDRQSTDLTGLDLDTLAGEPEKECPPWVSGCQQKAKSGLTKMMQKEDRASIETDDGMRIQMDTMKADISTLKAAHEAMKTEQRSLK